MCVPNRSEVQAIPLPEGLHATSSDVIANLNEHLIQTLHQLDAKDKKLAELATELTVSVHWVVFLICLISLTRSRP